MEARSLDIGNRVLSTPPHSLSILVIVMVIKITTGGWSQKANNCNHVIGPLPELPLHASAHHIGTNSCSSLVRYMSLFPF